MSKVDIRKLRIFLSIEKRPDPSSRCDNTSWFIRLELQRDGDSSHLSESLAEGGFEPLTVSLYLKRMNKRGRDEKSFLQN